MLLAAARTILLEQGDLNATPGISYDAWLVKTVVPMWIVGWATLRLSALMWWLAARRR